MGKQIIKVDRDADLYMEWSSVVDAPTFIGTRDEMCRYLIEEDLGSLRVSNLSDVEARLVRADETGTSGLALGCAWDDSGLIYYQIGWLPRAAFPEFARRLQASGNVDDLLEPFED